MPRTERIVVRRPLRFRKEMVPTLFIDGITWRLHRDGTISFPDFGEKGHRPNMPIETFAYVLPLFGLKDVEFRASDAVTFSTREWIPNMSADAQRVFYRVGDASLYLTKSGLIGALKTLQVLSPRTYRDLSRLKPLPIHE